MFKRDKTGTCCLWVIIAVIVIGILAPWLAPHDPLLVNLLNKFQPISSQYWLGTDQLGRCVLSRLMYGVRSTVFMALASTMLTLLLGIVVGFLAGYLGRRVDNVLMRFCDIVLSFPSDIIILAIISILQPDMLNMVLTIALIKWAWYARMIRTMVQRYKTQHFVLFAQVMNGSAWYVLRRHILPSVLTEIVALATINIGGIILMISALSFLGFGIALPTPEWGNMLKEAKDVMTTRPFLMVPPGVAITLLVICFNYLGDSLQDHFDRVYQSSLK